MRICFFYRLGGVKTSYEFIKSFIRYLKTIHSKVIILPKFSQGGIWLSQKSKSWQRNDDLVFPKHLLSNLTQGPHNTCIGMNCELKASI